MDKERKRIKKEKIIIDNLDNGFVIGLFALVIATFFKTKACILVFVLLFIYFIVYFCYITPYIKRHQENIKKEINQERAQILFEWAKENNKEENLKKYMNEFFDKRNDEIFASIETLNPYDIEEDIKIIGEIE